MSFLGRGHRLLTTEPLSVELPPGGPKRCRPEGPSAELLLGEDTQGEDQDSPQSEVTSSYQKVTLMVVRLVWEISYIANGVSLLRQGYRVGFTLTPNHLCRGNSQAAAAVCSPDKCFSPAETLGCKLWEEEGASVLQCLRHQGRSFNHDAAVLSPSHS